MHETPPLIFNVIINRRTISSILDATTKRLLEKCKNLCNELLTMGHNDRKKFIAKLEQYSDLKNGLIAKGLFELLPPVTILYPKNTRKQKYHHKQVEIKRKEVVSTEDLLRENDSLLLKLRQISIDSILPRMPEFERYKIVLMELKCRGIQMFDRLYYNYKLGGGQLRKRKRLIKLLGGVCAKCGSLKNLTLHHIVPLSKGGSSDVTNLRVLCKKCHCAEHGITSVNPVMVAQFKKAGIKVSV